MFVRELDPICDVLEPPNSPYSLWPVKEIVSRVPEESTIHQGPMTAAITNTTAMIPRTTPTLDCM